MSKSIIDQFSNGCVRSLKSYFFILFLLFNSILHAKDLQSFEFYNQDLKDIVYVLSMRSGKSIVCDDTVVGMGNFLYVAQNNEEKSFDEIFDAFLYANKLFVTKTTSLWIVSKVKIDVTNNNKITVNSYESSISTILEKISEKISKSITYEVLPTHKISLHIQDVDYFDAVKLILQPYSEYVVTETASGFQITKRKANNYKEIQTDEERICDINYSNGYYDINIRNAKIESVLNNLFSYENAQYSSFVQSEDIVKSISFYQKNFSESLSLILEQVNSEAVYSDNVWYLFQKVSKSSKDSVQARNKKWFFINPIHYPSSKIVPLISTKYPSANIIEISNSKLALYITKEEYEDIKGYMHNLDENTNSDVISLKYIRTSDLLNLLPPAISREEIVDTGTGHSVFFIGTQDKRKLFVNQLKEIDLPKKLVRYDLLILQYDKGSNLSWGISTSIKPTKLGDRTLIYGDVGNLLNINFDAITSFGLTFSEKINAAIANNDASVFADTTLYGLSGEKIIFKNTNTYRYRDATLDQKTGKEVYSTVTREITSGLVLEIDGWVSGDNIITMSVNTSVSKQGVDTSNTTGNPPATTEKNITTKIRAKDGEPVILSGLSQNSLSTSSQGIPGVSKIPVLGNLFKKRNTTKEKTEMTIYLVPHIEQSIAAEKNESWKKLLYELVVENKGFRE